MLTRCKVVDRSADPNVDAVETVGTFNVDAIEQDLATAAMYRGGRRMASMWRTAAGGLHVIYRDGGEREWIPINDDVRS